MDFNYQKIYEQLGNLFYSVAASDGHVKTKEIVKLKEIIDRDWLPLEESKDEFGIDAAHYIYITFDYLIASLTSAEDAFRAFASYYESHRSHFTKELKKKILKTSAEIANVFGGVNKSEISILTRLNLLLQ